MGEAAERWFVVWNVGNHLDAVQLEKQLGEAAPDTPVRVYYPTYAALTVYQEPVKCPLYPGYLFIQGQWSGEWEQVLRSVVEGAPRFLLDVDSKEPLIVPPEQMEVVFEQVRRLDTQEIFVPADTLRIGDDVLILRRPWEHVSGKIASIGKGVIFVELPWGSGEQTMTIQVPASQVQKVSA